MVASAPGTRSIPHRSAEKQRQQRRPASLPADCLRRRPARKRREGSPLSRGRMGLPAATHRGAGRRSRLELASGWPGQVYVMMLRKAGGQGGLAEGKVG